MNEINQATKNKIKSILFSIGINEKYASFNYLTTLLTLLLNQAVSKESFKILIGQVSKYYNVATRTVTQGLNKILKTCNNPTITTKFQFIMTNNGTFNKICVVKKYIEDIFAN